MSEVGFIGRLGNGLVLNGVNQYLSVPGNFGYAAEDAVLTFCCHFQFKAFPALYTPIVWTADANGSDYNWLFYVRNGNGFSRQLLLERARSTTYKLAYNPLTLQLNRRYCLIGVANGANVNNWAVYVGEAGSLDSNTSVFANASWGGSPAINQLINIGGAINYDALGNNYYSSGCISDLRIYNYAFTRVDAQTYLIREGNWNFPNLIYRPDFNRSSGKIITDNYSGKIITLQNFTDAETASNGQPQSGNTAWVNAYTQLPIIK